jgi:4a-hydroxytetrahydrobiopterin dehydratase
MEDKTALSKEEVLEELKKLDGWKLEFKCISKRFYIEDWGKITAFLKYLVNVIKETNHHPDIIFHTATKTITVSTTTHSEGGITKADIELARRLNEFEQNMI